ncbi:TIGR03085 family metal-binding protein [Cellulomonas xylanilytica]|uniref:TIGR03085 family protein n=1 Tax=Cellulomonas xylanilytica TaxID=233583 RepID=A0A510V2M6_9CELL|nr:TIGR03085 family metal-binding protein [Cellulomonas xylanilytica]GEK21147.1 TIGR03085 family protein [Cellulomonas xylanilytica]
MTWHEIERAQLAQALLDVTPDAPTLCEGWQARHLAAHVVLRERSPVVGAGIAVPALSARAEAAIARLADQAATEGAYRDLVARVADTPPGWHPASWVGESANVVEFFVHTEDVRRGAGSVPPRELEPGLVDALWSHLPRAATGRLRSVPVGVVLVRDDGVRHRLRAPKPDHGTVVVRGDAPEIVLYLLGRGAAADVRVEGDADDLAVIEAALPSR